MREATQNEHCRRGWQSPTYRAWRDMLTRCRNPTCTNWKNYGARGITVCARWLKFANFLADMGARPAPSDGTRLTLERRENSGNYKPGNCYWATYTAQIRNRRSSRLTLDLAQEILGRIEHGESSQSIANRMNLPVPSVGGVKTGRMWPELDRNGQAFSFAPRRPQRRLTLDDAQEVLGRYEHGESIPSIVRRMNSTKGCIHALVHGRSWKDLGRPYLHKHSPSSI